MKLICIHRIEGEDACFYLRPDTALLRNNQAFYYPGFTQQLTAQLCRVYRVGRLGRSIAPRFAARYVDAVGAGALFTAADVLAQCVQNGHPWDVATGFDYSAAVSPEFISVEEITNCESLDRRSQLRVSDSIENIIAYVSRFLTLKIGDYIFVPVEEPREVRQGDRVESSLEGKCTLRVDVR